MAEEQLEYLEDLTGNNIETQITDDGIAYENLMEIPAPVETLTPEFATLMDKASKFISTIIKNHASQLYKLVGKTSQDAKNFYDENNRATITKCIVAMTNSTFNKILHNFQNKIPDVIVNEFTPMLDLCSYGPHILLNKLLVMTLDVHMDVMYDTTDVADLTFRKRTPFIDHMKVVNKQVDKLLIKYSSEFMEILRKTEKDNSEYKPVPEGQSAFDCKIEEFELTFNPDEPKVADADIKQ
jgi:hypothetical protein